MRAQLQPAFGKNLRAVRFERGLRQADLAGDGLTQSYISHLEAGRREPTAHVVDALARRLSVSPERLTGRAENERLELTLAVARASAPLCADPSSGTEEFLRRALDLPADAHDRYRAAYVLAGAREREGDLEGAVRLLEPVVRALPHALDAADVLSDELLAAASTALSRCYREAGDVHRAVEVAQSAADQLAICQPKPRGYAQLVATLAFAHTDRGDLLTASVVLGDLINECNRVDDRSGRAAAYWNASLVAADRGQLIEALRLIERATALVAEDDDLRALARIKISQAWVLMSLPIPDPARAGELLETALPELRRHASATDLASAHTELARVAIAMGRLRDAVDQAQIAIDLLSEHPNLESARAVAVLGEALLALGDRAEGLARLNAAANTLGQAGASRESAALWRQLGELYARGGSSDDAVRAYARALDALGIRGEVMDARVVADAVPLTAESH